GLFSMMTAGRQDMRGYYTQPLIELYPSELVNQEALQGYVDQSQLDPSLRVSISFFNSIFHKFDESETKSTPACWLSVHCHSRQAPTTTRIALINNSV